MTSHPNRSRSLAAPGRNPTASEIKAARAALHLGPESAAALIFGTATSWRLYEEGTRRMHPAVWEAWQARAKLVALGMPLTDVCRAPLARFVDLPRE